eukprot:CAMPEP_0202011190 /NCGR_PEP_ID=MMETSP0905-20130828/18761_1 /ASSEMBLY_ACC=CAM_ASM_000554 /TAXON_ID=420261 /ORGANISM="Thalassiosira antarctica, Strain CCMP982" /LENGTH=43 /DNA_ID= /DNA_START= /DNA_END= /DNA_ORIENTATION=
MTSLVPFSPPPKNVVVHFSAGLILVRVWQSLRTVHPIETLEEG